MLLYMDDIILFSADFSQHLKDLQEVLETLRKVNITINAKKSKFMQKQISYLDLTISESGISVDEDKIKAIGDLKQPATVKQLRSFLGQTQFYRRHIQGYSQIATPLYDLVAKHTDKGGGIQSARQIKYTYYME